MKITLIVGLPGSGKTHLAKTIAKETDADLFDDTSLNRNVFMELIESDDKRNKIITDQSLCSESARSFCIKLLSKLFPSHEMEWIYFENNPEKCHNNVRSRQDESRHVDNLIDFLSKSYTIPNDVKPLSIWKETI